MISTILINVFALSGALVIFASSIRMLREKDAFCRISALGPAASVGLPLIITAAYIEELSTSGWNMFVMFRFLLTVVLLLAVASVATNVLGRAAYQSGAKVSEDTSPQDMARKP